MFTTATTTKIVLIRTDGIKGLNFSIGFFKANL